MKQKERELENNIYFWQKLDVLVLSSRFVLDRPKHTAHRQYANLIYPVDYGYLQDSFSTEQDPIYAYQGTSGTDQVEAIIVSADILKKDCVVKLLIGCTEEEINKIMAFINSMEFQKAILVRRGQETPGWAVSE